MPYPYQRRCQCPPATHLVGGAGNDRAINTASTQKIDRSSAYDLDDAGGATDIRRCQGPYQPNPYPHAPATRRPAPNRTTGQVSGCPVPSGGKTP